MTFKKDGADPETTRPQIALRFIGAMFETLGIGVAPSSKEHDEFNRRSRDKPTPAKKHRNMLHVSKRVRRKHRRAI